MILHFSLFVLVKDGVAVDGSFESLGQGFIWDCCQVVVQVFLEFIFQFWGGLVYVLGMSEFLR